MTDLRCESCGMPVNIGPYCVCCIGEDGTLQAFEDRLEGMVRFILSRNSGLDATVAEERARAYMRMMPAWRDHPALTG